jgi:hypothetical protein
MKMAIRLERFAVAALAVTLALVWGQPVSAQGLGGLGNFVKSVTKDNNNSSSTTESVIDAVGFYARFQAARIEMNAAQIELAMAFDLKDQVTLLEEEQSRLKSGPLDAGGMKKSTELSENTTAMIDQKMAEQSELSDVGKQHFNAAIPHLLAGTLLTVQLAMEAKSTLSSASFIEKASLMVSLKDVPSLVKTTVGNYKRVIAYGQANKIKMPKDATDALGTL